MSTQIEGGNWYQECQQLRAQLAEAQMETKKHRANAQAALNQLQSQAAQLVGARELEVQMTATGARANLALIKERDALSAQLAGMREALADAQEILYAENLQIASKYAEVALDTPVSEWEKRVQGLVGALHEIENLKFGYAGDSLEISRAALAAWEGKAESRQGAIEVGKVTARGVEFEVGSSDERKETPTERAERAYQMQQEMRKANARVREVIAKSSSKDGIK